jgi:hypothetical protein
VANAAFVCEVCEGRAQEKCQWKCRQWGEFGQGDLAAFKEWAMSFEETKEGFFWTCNHCGVVAEFPPFDFWRALAELKARGWRIERDEEGGGYGDWAHYCAKCRKTAAERILNSPVVKMERRR